MLLLLFLEQKKRMNAAEYSTSEETIQTWNKNVITVILHYQIKSQLHHKYTVFIVL